MRCPKCGYISFDHLEVCLKCKKNVKSVSDLLAGSVFNAQAPTFLKMQTGGQEVGVADDMDMFGDQSGSDEDFVDEDLKVLVDDEELESEIEFSLDDDDEISAPQLDKEFDFSDDGSEAEEDDDEIELDLSQFEASPDPEEASFEDSSISIEMPEELADISDLAPPEQSPTVEGQLSSEPVEDVFPDLDLEDLDFDLESDDVGAEMPARSSGAQEVVLALDDIDFSDALTDGDSKPSSKSTSVDMDEDLNFDLDLGGLSIHKDV